MRRWPCHINRDKRARHLSKERRRRLVKDLRAVEDVEHGRTRLIEIVATVLSLSGALLNALAHVEGFYVWLVANALWIVFSVRLKRWGLLTLFVAYEVLAVVGIISWG